MHVFDRLHLGGTEKIIMKLVNGLRSDGWEHSICTTRGVGASATAWASGINVLHAGGPVTPEFRFNVLRLAKVMRQVRPTIVHSRNWGGIESIFAGRLAGIPVVIHSEHGYQLEMLSGLPLRQRLLRHVAYRCANAVFTVSEELRRYHSAQAYWNPKAIQVLYNGVDGEVFRPQPQLRNPIREQFGIPAQRFVIGFVGRLVSLKDLPTLLKAVEALVPRRPEVHVLLVGAGRELPSLQRYASESPHLQDRVTFAGPAENVAELLNAMDVFVLPSLNEGMSNTLLEALATGLPCVATRAGGNPEIVDDGACGYLYRAGAALELTHLLERLCSDPDSRQTLGLAARARVLKEFSLTAMLKRYHDLYVSLASQKSAAMGSETYVRN
jgi:sugar transferase (PEP-CTERM/EpsH1 system associated)